MTNRYIVDILGPYHVIQNDTTIMKEIKDASNVIRSLLEPGDIFIADRGFHDAKTHIE